MSLSKASLTKALSEEQQDALKCLDNLPGKKVGILVSGRYTTGKQFINFLEDLFGPDNVEPKNLLNGQPLCAYHQQCTVRSFTGRVFVLQMINPSVVDYALDPLRYNHFDAILHIIGKTLLKDLEDWMEDIKNGRSQEKDPVPTYCFFRGNPGIDLEKLQELFDEVLNDPPPIECDFSNLKNHSPKPSMLGIAFEWLMKHVPKKVPVPALTLQEEFDEAFDKSIKTLGADKKFGIVWGTKSIKPQKKENVTILNDRPVENIQGFTRQCLNSDVIVILPQKKVADYEMWHEEFEIQLHGTNIPVYMMDFHLSEETKKFAQDNNIELI